MGMLRISTGRVRYAGWFTFQTPSRLAAWLSSGSIAFLIVNDSSRRGDVGHKGLLVAESEDPVAEQDFWGRDMRE